MVVYHEGDLSTHPHCDHGPTIMFSRTAEGRKFFACSAFRDRKLCPFFCWADQKRKDSSIQSSRKEQLLGKVVEYNRQRLLINTEMKTLYCHECEQMLCDDRNNVHKNHKLTANITSYLRSHPSKLLKPRNRNKGESQYHFNERTVKFICSVISSLNSSTALCIGCPTIHEYFFKDCNNGSIKLSSCLLDIDYRYRQFYDAEQFIWFNMFNFHTFEDSGLQTLKSIFERSRRISVVIDPPFGGHIEALAYTIKEMNKLKNNINEKINLSILFISPYFMEKNIKRSLPEFNMVDYKVEYINHSKFKAAGSPVRIFTNVNLSAIVLPEEENYKFCFICKKWVSFENVHCVKCGTCTSKNGRTYKHCNTCNKCVKQTWKHCKKCKKCTLTGHKCVKSYRELNSPKKKKNR